ncbi:histone-lysine N-methyltransferase SETMAR-like [Plakobranchus ocellatus]|uniref:Glycosyltransferase family 92 protein n=1 Tax=Plakobranchus ocellatus TaxID=259542 RepID=A0AAV4A766_9GAST|nr:histone-lysine N-methyltransferase SETMAR-like [Plakobranchus ocellatus]
MIADIRHLWDKKNYSRIIKLPNVSLSDRHQDFQEVKNLGLLLYVHAALWQGDHVRITVVKKLNVPVYTALCVLWFSSDQNARPYFVQAVVRDLRSYTFDNACGYIKCILQTGKNETNEIPVLVSLVDGTDIESGLKITLPIEDTRIHTDDKKENISFGKEIDSKIKKTCPVEFTVCVPTMFSFGNAGMLVEKLEMSRLLGAGRVVLYNTSIKPNVDAVLRMYSQEFAAGREKLEVIVHSWNIPPITMHYLGQIAAMDDCLYRYKWSSRYIVFTDMDEFIIPFHHASWSGLIADREKLKPGSAAFKIRSTIESLEVHDVYEGYGPTDNVPPDQALLYHYRMPLRKSCTDIRDTRVADKYGQKLLQGLKAAWAKLKKVPSGWNPTNETERAQCRNISSTAKPKAGSQ